MLVAFSLAPGVGQRPAGGAYIENCETQSLYVGWSKSRTAVTDLVSALWSFSRVIPMRQMVK